MPPGQHSEEFLNMLIFSLGRNDAIESTSGSLAIIKSGSDGGAPPQIRVISISCLNNML